MSALFQNPRHNQGQCGRSGFLDLTANRLFSLKHTLAAAALASAAVSTAANPAFWEAEWPRTDFTTLRVAANEIMSGGPPKDGIPSITDPELIPAHSETRLNPRESVIAVSLDGESRAYPVRYLLWHEIVNDRIGATPIAVTYCPLCNSGIVFDRRVNAELRTFGVSGKLRHSDMIMFDRETESWWQQAVGEGIAGVHAGDILDVIPALTMSWDDFVTSAGEDGLVMDQPRHSRPYGSNPYVGYDTSESPFLYFGENPPNGINPLARVVRVGELAWPLERLRLQGSFTENGYRFSWRTGQASPLDTRNVADGREIGTVRVEDELTGDIVAHDIMFAFAFHAFFPDGEWQVGE